MTLKFLDEFRRADWARALAAEIAQAARSLPVTRERPLKIMEVCGGHTHTIYKYGVKDLLPPEIDLVHGPGCPVCVIPMGRVDDAIFLARQEGVIFTTYGDMMRVPGSRGSLQDARAGGADVRMVYSPLDALRVARNHPDQKVIFFGVGMETTAPSTAVTLLRARQEGIKNFSVFCNHVNVIPAIKALLDSPGMQLDGFVGPGHVATVIGARPFEYIPAQYGRPVVISGFEPLDVLQGLQAILRQLVAGSARVEIQYTRVVRPEGSPQALAAMARVFELRPFFEWRGLGSISHSALKLRPEWAEHDAEVLFSMPGLRIADPKACQCGEVLKGVVKPWECKVFGTACTPETPIGTCMVSSEGACAAYYNYGRYQPVNPKL